MKRKFISMLLSLSVFCTVMMPGVTVHAVSGENDGHSGMVIHKTATANENGTYTVRLEAYATGDKVITEITKDVPTDIVLVLDQSGSMSNPIGEVSFKPYQDRYGENRTNSYHYANRHNGGRANLYYPIGDGAYASVSVTIRQSEPDYNEITNGRNNSSLNGRTSYWINRNNLYALVKGEYVKVGVNRYRQSYRDDYEYTYTLPDGTVISTSTGDTASPAFSGTDTNVLYLLTIDASQNVYTYTYTSANGETQMIGTSVGPDTRFETTLYERVVDTGAGDSRISALRTALGSFTSAVNTKAAGEDGQLGTEDDVNHRIAVVGYAYGDRGYGSDLPYTNTEVFIGASQYMYGSAAQSVYGEAFQNMNSPEGQSNVAASIGALTANGATYTNLGVEMANGILNANPVEAGGKRNRVVIVFTDGAPGWSGYESVVADAAITEADKAKAAGATVYSVGIFAGADATSAGNADGSDTQKANWFMQNLSSNNGTVQSPGYYLSAADAASLNDIFQQISDNIETGGSTTTLSGETVIRDMIAPEFGLAEGADASHITLKTYSYTGENQWEENYNNTMGASAFVEGNTVSVTGFDFAENYVGTVTENGRITYRGHKLEIIFDVSPKEGFLGGNNVYTNASAGVYENSEAQNPILTFERPQVNVPVGEVKVIGEDKNVYLLNSLSAQELCSGAGVTVGGISLKLDPDTENYGLEDWQTSGVNISVVITDADGKVISEDLTGLREDTAYNLMVTVSPKDTALPASSGTEAETQSGNAGANIYVFKPELTYMDSKVYYKAEVPSEFTENLTTVKWKHGETEADSAIMGIAPKLNLIYTVDAMKVENGKINTKQDVGVDAAVMIGDTDVTVDTGFIHTDCDPACGWMTPMQGGTPAFLLHVRTCQLTIIKTGGDEHEPYVFDIIRDGKKYSEITIIGNGSETIYELPVGNYRIKEDEGWSWRYSADNGESVILAAWNSMGSITCSNRRIENYWLNGFSEVVKNISGVEP